MIVLQGLGVVSYGVPILGAKGMPSSEKINNQIILNICG
jgi:hypothetical protein